MSTSVLWAIIPGMRRPIEKWSSAWLVELSLHCKYQEHISNQLRQRDAFITRTLGSQAKEAKIESNREKAELPHEDDKRQNLPEGVASPAARDYVRVLLLPQHVTTNSVA